MARTNKKLEKALNFQFHPASDKTYQEAIVFVHFFDGSPKQIGKHIELVNKLGYDAYSYQVAFHLQSRSPLDIFNKNKRIGLRNIWSKDLEYILSKIKGDKILYAFSNPSSAAIEVTANQHTKGKADIKAIVCDSGPFMNQYTCSYNLIKDYYKIKSPLISLPSAIAISLALSPFHESYLEEDLKKLPKNFPILSIRGWKDKLVPLRAIEKVFEKQEHLDLEVLNLTDADHLNGLKDFADLYVPKVKRFLSRFSTRL